MVVPDWARSTNFYLSYLGNDNLSFYLRATRKAAIMVKNIFKGCGIN